MYCIVLSALLVKTCVIHIQNLAFKWQHMCCTLHSAVADRELTWCTVHSAVADRERTCCTLHSAVADRERTCCTLHSAVVDRERTCCTLHSAVADRELTCCTVHSAVADRELTGRLRKMRRNLRSRLSRCVTLLAVKKVINAVTRPLWMISNGDMSVSLTMLATSFRLAASSAV